MKFDDIIVIIGQFGRYQKQHYGLLCLPAVVVAIQNMISVFILAQPPHRCAVPGYSNDTFSIQSPFHNQLVDYMTPKGDDGLYAECSQYDIPSETVLSFQGLNSSSPSYSYYFNDTGQDARENETTKTCHRWVYDQSNFESSIITELNLVCDLKWSRSHAQMFLMLGSLFGATFLGPPADFFGRKRMMMFAIVFTVASSIGIAFTPSFLYLCIFFFINGASTATVYITTFVLGIELVGPQKRMYAGFIIAVFYGLGVVILSSMAYFIRNWQPLQLVLASFSLPFLAYYWIVPESARWLISHARFKEAEDILKRAAQVNGKSLPAEALQWSHLDEQGGGNTEPLWRIVAYPRLVARSFIISLNWLICSMTYYGLGLNVGSLAGSIYANSIMYGVVEIICYFICIPLIERLGRRHLHISCMFLGGIFCTITPFPSLYLGLDWLTRTLAVIGKFGVSGAFATIWVYTSELYPTVVRNSGVSSSALSGFLGGVISPYIANLSVTIEGTLGQILPMVIFGTSAIAAGLLSLYLPETKNMKLPDTLKEADEFGRGTGEEEEESAPAARPRSWVINVPPPGKDEDEAGRKALLNELETPT